MTPRPKYYPLVLSGGDTYNAAAEHQENIIGNRIAQAREAKGLSLAEFSDLLQKHGLAIRRQGLSKWENGLSVPNAYQLLAVCHALEIEDGISYFTNRPAKKPELNSEGLKKLRAYREDLIASGRYTPVCKNNITYIQKPVSLLPASAGPGAFLDDENFELISFPENAVPPQADFGIRISGDSMEPVYHDGQIVWVRQTSQLMPGEVGLFLYDSEGFIKVYQEQEPADREAFLDSSGVLHMQPVLLSYNKNYPPKPISPELSFSIVGKIL